MSDITVIGLGLMGSALAGALLEHGLDVTAWNRTPERAAAVVAGGAHLATDAASAVVVSPIVVVCVLDYDASLDVLAGATDQFAGRVLIQLSTGTPHEARAMDQWARDRAATYLDGAILNSPNAVGKPGSVLYVSGDALAYERSEPILRMLADNVSYKGERPGAAAAWDFMMVSHYYGQFLNFFHAVQICRAEGLLVEDYAEALQAEGRGFLASLARNVVSGDHSDTLASIGTWASAVERIAQHAEEAGIDAGYISLSRDLFRKGMAAGYGDQEVSALVNLIGAD